MDSVLEQRKTGLRNARICFVDNESEFRNWLKNRLEESGALGTFWVTDYHEAVSERAKQNEYDILVCDYKMPGKDGLQILEEVRQRTQRIILVLLTGYVQSPQSEVRVRCEEAGIHCLKKISGVSDLLGNLDLLWRQRHLQKAEPLVVPAPKRFAAFKERLFWTRKASQTVETGHRSLAENEKPAASPPVPLLPPGPTIDTAGDLIGNEVTVANYRDMKKILLDLAVDLLQDLEQAKDPSAVVQQASGNMKPAELKQHIENLTPLGMTYIKLWFQAEQILRKSK